MHLIPSLIIIPLSKCSNKHIERFNNCQARYIIFLYLWYHLKRLSKKGSGSCAWFPRIEPNESSHFLSDCIIITLYKVVIYQEPLFIVWEWENDWSKGWTRRTDWSSSEILSLSLFTPLSHIFDSQKKPNDSQDKFYFLSCGCRGFVLVIPGTRTDGVS